MSMTENQSLSPQKSRAQHGSMSLSCPSMPPVLLGSICAQPGMHMKGSISVKPGMPTAKGSTTVNLQSPTLQRRSISASIASPRLPELSSGSALPRDSAFRFPLEQSFQASLASPKLPRDSAFRFPLEQPFQARRHSDTSTLTQKSAVQETSSRPRRSSDFGVPRGSPQISGLTQASNSTSEDLSVRLSLDPVQDPSLKSEIFSKLGLPQSAQIERLSGNCGGLNLGVWIIHESSSQQTLVLKLVSSQAKFGRSEAETLRLLGHKYPSLASDEAIAFPIKIFSCVDPAGKRSHDFIVMRKVLGKPVGDVIGMKWSTGQKTDVMKILRELGSFLARFHKRYGNSQHCDFQPSNVFYDTSSGKFAMIDIADLGEQCSENDVKHFVQSLRLLSRSYGEQFFTEGKRNFEEGYKFRA